MCYNRRNKNGAGIALRKKWNRYAVLLPFLLVLLILFVQYAYDFPQGDDFLFYNRGGSLPKIWSYYQYYYSVAGSRMANLFAQILLLWNLAVWKILTPLVSASISVLIFYYAKGRILPDAQAEPPELLRDCGLAAVCAVFPGFVPFAYSLYADTFLWMDGSCNYLYPLLFMMIGFLPVYQALRGRPTAKWLRFVSPVCLLVGGLLHEQTALFLFAACAASFLYLKKDGKMDRYLAFLCALSLLVLIFTLTCPGAYLRFARSAPAGADGPVRRILKNMWVYFGAIFGVYRLWIALLGLCCLHLLRGKAGKRQAFFRFYLIFGLLLSLVSEMLRIPAISAHPLSPAESPVMFLFQAALIAYWVLYLFVCFLVMLAAREGRENRFLVPLYLGMGASQGIPLLLGSWGRPLLLIMFTVFLMAVALFDDFEYRLLPALRTAAFAVGLCSMVLTMRAVVQNRAPYEEMIAQVDAVKRGESSTVVIDYRRFRQDYFYFNAFHPAYTKEIKIYYGLPEDTELKIIK